MPSLARPSSTLSRATRPVGEATGYADLLARALDSRDADATLLSDEFGEISSLTRAQLRDRVDQLSARLRRAGCGPEVLVALRFSPGVEAVVAILGVLASGAAYLPLDPRHGERRLATIIGATTPDFVLSPQGLRPLNDRPAARPSRGLDDLGYVISTSGSTGTPKAAMIEQRGLVRHTQAMIELLDLGPDDVVLQTAPPSFDIAVWQSTTAVIAGARTHVVGSEARLDPRALAAVIQDQGATVIQLVPSMLRVLLDVAPPRNRLRLRHVISTGEALDPALANRWFDTYPDLALTNLYGPAECSDDVSVHVMHRSVDPGDSVPIGQAFAGCHLHLIDEAGAEVGPGEVGEIEVCGEIVGRGYRNDPDRTAAAFGRCQHRGCPTSAGSGTRTYRTGDLATRDAAGLLRYVGRRDFQIKVRGNRVELGEIESTISAAPEVRACVVTRFGDETDRLAAHVEAVTEVDRAALRALTVAALPDYMVPSAFVVYPRLPLSANGKVDRDALRLPEAGDLVAASGRAATTATERVLAANWGRLLELDDVPVDADFFDLGGTSLLAVISIDELGRELGVELPTRVLITQGSIERVAAAIDAGLGEAPVDRETGLVTIQRTAGTVPLFLYPGEAVSALGLVDLGRLIAPGRTVFAFEPARPIEGDPPASMAELAGRCARAIAQVAPDGPVHLGGFCMGGDVAWEIATQRQAAGQATASVLLLQTERDGVYPRWSNHGSIRVVLARIAQRVRFEIATAKALGPVQRRSHVRHLVLGKVISKLTVPLAARLHRRGLLARFGSGPSLRMRQRLWAQADRASYRGWQPQPLECPVSVIAASEQPPLVDPDPLLGWGDLARQASARQVGGFHWSFLHHPSVVKLAEVVSEEMARHDEAAGR